MSPGSISSIPTHLTPAWHIASVIALSSSETLTRDCVLDSTILSTHHRIKRSRQAITYRGKGQEVKLRPDPLPVKARLKSLIS